MRRNWPGDWRESEAGWCAAHLDTAPGVWSRRISQARAETGFFSLSAILNGGEGRGEVVLLWPPFLRNQGPLSLTLSPLVPRGARETRVGSHGSTHLSVWFGKDNPGALLNCTVSAGWCFSWAGFAVNFPPLWPPHYTI